MNEHKALKEEIGDYTRWRKELSSAIETMSSFLKSNNVTDLRTHHEFEQVLGALADDNLSVAFVAEFSRGKSEMINTIFFGGYASRVLPSGTGRTTMCPTELVYNPSKATGIRFLPIESRTDSTPLYELKNRPDLWHEIEFNENNPKSLQEAMSGLTDNKLVSKEYAKKLNFNIREQGDSNVGLQLNKYDEVEIPKWRHAIINLPHPLLEQGLVILDTPGLNAIGTEPELTLTQLASAHTVVFILSMDSGVTASDLALWQQHLGGTNNGQSSASGMHNKRKLIALNKIDSLWDGIRTESDINAEIERQVWQTAKTLDINPENIFPVSAQKGFVGRVSRDEKLIERSRIKHLESAIATRLVPEKKLIVIDRVRRSLDEIIETAGSILGNRMHDAAQHIAELKQISSKNTDVISHIMLKVQSEKSSLEHDMQRYLALRSVYSKETGRLIALLSNDRLERLIAITKHNMLRCASSITLQKTINKFFEKLNHYLDQAIEQATAIAVLSEKITRDFEQDHGISNFHVRRLRLEKYKVEVQRLEQKHAHLKATKTLFFKEQVTITNRFYESVSIASRKLFANALRDANNWNNNLMVPMETYVREHHTQLRRRLESVKRIHKASDTVETRLKELAIIQQQLLQQDEQFNQLKQNLANLLKTPIAVDNKKQAKQNSADILYWDHNTNF